MKKENLSSLVKWAKESMTPEDVFVICKDNRMTDIIPRHIIQEYSRSEEIDEMISIASFCDRETLIYLLEKSQNMEEDVKVDLQVEIARNQNCDDEIVNILLKTHEPYIDSCIAGNKKTSTKILNKICSRKCSKFALPDVVRNPNCSVTIAEKLVKDLSELSVDTKLALAKKTRVSADVLERLYEDKDASVAYEAAKRLLRVDELCNRLTSSKSDDDKKMLAEITSSKEVLKELCHHKNPDVVCKAIANEYCPMDEVSKLSDSDNEFIRLAVAQKKHVSISLLAKLSEDGSKGIRQAVAKNENTPSNILEKLSYDASWWVRKAVAENKNTRDDTLFQMYIGDKDTEVMYQAGKNIKAYWRFDFESVIGKAKRYYYNQLYGYLENPNVSGKDLLTIALRNTYSERIWEIIDKIAKNPNANDAVFDRIVEEIASNSFFKCNYETNGAICSIVGNNNFKQLEEFVQGYFNS